MSTAIWSETDPVDNEHSACTPIFRFAAARDDRPVLIHLRVPVCNDNSQGLRPDDPILDCAPSGLAQLAAVTSTADFVSITVRVASATSSDQDDEVRFQARASAGGATLCHVILRRTSCRLQTALLGGPPEQTLLPQTRAALLWHGWRRCTELVGLKQFGTGFSNTKVLVFRPRLAAPSHGDNPHLLTSSPVEVLHNSWGSWLLVKTGKHDDIHQEWQRFQVYVRDRMHPFLARSESFVAAELASDATPNGSTSDASATLISSFVGGELIRAEPLEQALCGCDEVARCKQLLDRVFAVLSSWHAPAKLFPLAFWKRAFHGNPPKDWKLFGRFDFSQRADREEYAEGLAWDSAFISERHLHRHLLGKDRDGLLYDLMSHVEVRFTLTHGDLNPRNVLCEEGNVWLIDFEHTGVAPTLIDFARMEVNLRIWCLDHQSGGQDLSAAAAAFEHLLLQHFHGGEGSLEPVREMATALGADPKELLKLAHCVAHVRTLATPYCNDRYADHRDYLAVLYLTVLSLVRFAGELPRRAANFRVLVSLAWELERVLCHIFGRHPFETERAEVSAVALLRSDWLDAPGATGRVRYALEGDDGRRILEPLAACRGVWQSAQHHLHVLDHTLLVLAYVEALTAMDDPVEGFLDPAALDRLVAGRLREQGLKFPAVPPLARQGARWPYSGLIPDSARGALKNALADRDAVRLVKWCALIHDVGKPGTRIVDKKGRVHFHGHPEYGLQLLSRHMTHLFQTENRRRLHHLVLRHHDHNNLAVGRPATARPGLLEDFLADPWKAAAENRFRDAWAECRRILYRKADGISDSPSAPEERRRDLPLLLLHGFADSLAARGAPHSPTIEIRAELYLEFLAVWQRSGDLQAVVTSFEACRERVTAKGNPFLQQVLLHHALPGDSQRGRFLEDLTRWGMEQCRNGMEVPSPESFAAEAERRLGKSSG